jgi:hypothetical protein
MHTIAAARSRPRCDLVRQGSLGFASMHAIGVARSRPRSALEGDRVRGKEEGRGGGWLGGATHCMQHFVMSLLRDTAEKSGMPHASCQRICMTARSRPPVYDSAVTTARLPRAYSHSVKGPTSVHFPTALLKICFFCVDTVLPLSKFEDERQGRVQRGGRGL